MSAAEQATVERERAAYIKGVTYALEKAGAPPLVSARIIGAAHAERTYEFPLPRAPRVVRDSTGVEWRYLSAEVLGEIGSLEYRLTGNPHVVGWWCASTGDGPAFINVTPERIDLWADLKARPLDGPADGLREVPR